MGLEERQPVPSVTVVNVKVFQFVVVEFNTK